MVAQDVDRWRPLVEQAYQGEVYGEAMYRAIAASQSDPDRAWKWEVLAQLETETKAHVRALVERLGGDTSEHAASRERAAAEVIEYLTLDWDALMHRFSAELADDIEHYRALERGAVWSDDDTAVLARLTRHEEAARAFCDAELSGAADTSIDAVLTALDATPPPRP